MASNSMGATACATSTATAITGNSAGNPSLTAGPNSMVGNDIVSASHVPSLQSVSSAKSGSTNAPECYGCHKVIKERYLLKALDHLWHEDCLKCVCCDCRLGEVGSTLFTKADLILCKRDYLRMFGATGLCSACNKQIPAFEMVMRARGNVYHLECFKCEACSHRFCVGDRFYLYDNKILCEYDYEERMVFANLNQMTSLDHIKRQTQELVEVCDGSSGYASGDSPFETNR
ncbi:unnamed protein product [Oppiella nova]|uniref:LIM zinc-binding domain-containing protein n=1 Tax=Oppiella nova TaxID=334625 RepID=A0A7R9M6A2_9ACAR|nr:unnamed protein product [Oppiella nova]CAG2170262.1 unnamed protein product [Oppiella nova]